MSGRVVILISAGSARSVWNQGYGVNRLGMLRMSGQVARTFKRIPTGNPWMGLKPRDTKDGREMLIISTVQRSIQGPALSRGSGKSKKRLKEKILSVLEAVLCR